MTQRSKGCCFASATPGPWHLSVIEEDSGYIWNDQGEYENDPVCVLYRPIDYETYAPCVNWQANARLIAAAPELLKALEDALIEFINIGEYDTCRVILMNQIEAAINKAKGL